MAQASLRAKLLVAVLAATFGTGSSCHGSCTFCDPIDLWEFCSALEDGCTTNGQPEACIVGECLISKLEAEDAERTIVVPLTKRALPATHTKLVVRFYASLPPQPPVSFEVRFDGGALCTSFGVAITCTVPTGASELTLRVTKQPGTAAGRLHPSVNDPDCVNDCVY